MLAVTERSGDPSSILTKTPHRCLLLLSLRPRVPIKPPCSIHLAGEARQIHRRNTNTPPPLISRRPTETRCVPRRSDRGRDRSWSWRQDLLPLFPPLLPPRRPPSPRRKFLNARGRGRTREAGPTSPRGPAKRRPARPRPRTTPPILLLPMPPPPRGAPSTGESPGTRLAIRTACRPTPPHPLIPIATAALLHPNRNSPRALPGLSIQSNSDFRTNPQPTTAQNVQCLRQLC